MTVDGRVSAWARAWQTLQAAEKIATRNRPRPDRVALHHLHTQARLYAMLAAVPADVGFAVGHWLEEQEREQIEKASRDDTERLRDLDMIMEWAKQTRRRTERVTDTIREARDEGES